MAIKFAEDPEFVNTQYFDYENLLTFFRKNIHFVNK